MIGPIDIPRVVSENIDILRRFAEYLEITTISNDFFRSVIFYFYKAIYFLAKSSKGVFESVLNFIDFTDSQQLNQLFATYKPLIWIIMMLSLMFVGYLIMFNKLQNRENVVTNLIILLVMMTLLPLSVSQLNNFIETFLYDARATEEEGESLTTGSVVDDIFLGSFVDVELLARNGWIDVDETSRLNILTPESMAYFDINQRITSTEIHPALNEKLSGDDGVPLERGRILPEVLKEYYYRFSVNYWRGLFGLGVLAFVYLIYAIITARLIFELAINKILALLISASDLHSGQRMKGAILEIIKGYLTILGMIFMTVIFGHFVNWLYHHPSAQQNKIAMSVLLMGSALAMIDGAKIFERILGVDVGVRSGNRALLSTITGGAMLVGLGKKAVGMGARGVSIATRNPSASGPEPTDGANYSDESTDPNSPVIPTANYEDPIQVNPEPENDRVTENPGQPHYSSPSRVNSPPIISPVHDPIQPSAPPLRPLTTPKSDEMKDPIINHEQPKNEPENNPDRPLKDTLPSRLDHEPVQVDQYDWAEGGQEKYQQSRNTLGDYRDPMLEEERGD